MKYTHESVYVYKNESVSFNYVKNPTMAQRMGIVEDVVSGVINDVNGYHPILFDYFLAVSIINGLTDIRLPESFVLSSEIVTESDILRVLERDINGFYDIVNAAKEEIEFIKQRIVGKSSIDGLVESLTVLVDKYGGMFDGMDVTAVADNIAKIATMSNISKPEMIEHILKFEKANKSNTESN